jgi:hypothetical protein
MKRQNMQRSGLGALRLAPAALVLGLAAVGLLHPCPVAAQSLFVNDATVHTMGPQAVLEDADILVRDGRIKAVGAGLPIPADAVLIEAAGRP